MGCISVQGPKLCWAPSPREYASEVAKQGMCVKEDLEAKIAKFQHSTKVWEPPVVSRWGDARSRRKKGRAPFYVVSGGRKDGVFYYWRHVQRSVAGLPEAHVRGLPSWKDAHKYAHRLRGV